MKFRMMFVAMLALLALVSVGCEHAEKAADHAGSAMEQGADKAAELAEDVAEGTGDVAGDLMEQAGNLTGEAKALFDETTAKLTEKQDELVTLKEKISGMSAKDLLSTEGQELKENAESLTTEISTLKSKLSEMLPSDG